MPLLKFQAKTPAVLCPQAPNLLANIKKGVQCILVDTLNRKVTDHLVITSVPERVKICESLKPSDSGLLTDHNAIILSRNPFPKIKRSMFDYRCSDFDGLRRHLQSLDLISENGDIDQDWLACKDTFSSAVSKFVPTKTLRRRNHLPWMNSTILHYIKKKNSVRTRMKRSCRLSEHECYVKVA